MPDNVITVPRPSRASYNPDRPIKKNKLLMALVDHLHHAEMHLPHDLRTGIHIKTIKTEGEAAEYIRQVTTRLHPKGKSAS